MIVELQAVEGLEDLDDVAELVSFWSSLTSAAQAQVGRILTARLDAASGTLRSRLMRSQNKGILVNAINLGL